MLYIGTSGFSYDDWKGPWYPPDLPRGKMFDYYAERMNAVEINSTFYHIASPRMMRSLVRRSEGRVRFAVKMSELVTHHGLLSKEVALSYCRGIEPAAEAGALGAVLLQFPFRFHWNAENRAYLTRAIDKFRHFPLVVEIRHRSWQCPQAWRFFHDRGISLCMMDMPRLRGLPAESIELTGPIAYIRFHGRNEGQWFQSEYPGASYDYLYNQDELEGWVDPVKRMERKAETTFAFFNNHVRAQAVENAYEFSALLGESISTPGYRDMFFESRAAESSSMKRRAIISKTYSRSIKN